MEDSFWAKFPLDGVAVLECGLRKECKVQSASAELERRVQNAERGTANLHSALLCNLDSLESSAKYVIGAVEF